MGFSIILSLAVLFQGAAGSVPADALAFLSSITQKYSDAKSYHIEAREERTDSNELSHSWHKTLLKAIVAPGGRYRYEGVSGFGSAILVSNGTTNWNYHLDEHQYTQDATAADAAEKRRFTPQEEIAVENAKYIVRGIRGLSTRLKSASFLPDEIVMLDGRSIECRVVQFTEADYKRRNPDYKVEERVWVDKSRGFIVKSVMQSDSYMILDSQAHVPVHMEDTTVYPVVQLDEQEPESSFSFSPPQDAKLVPSFPDPFSHTRDVHTSDFVGKPAPEIRLKSEGKKTTLSSYRGKPVFVEFWATWCGPCVELMPDLKKLYAQTSSHGLAWVSIDSDDDPSAPAKFVKDEQIPWPNFHDEDGSLGKAFGREVIPLGVLIDAEGKVVFYGAGYDIAQLRSAIAKLGPEFSSVAAASTVKDSPKP